MKEEYYLIKFSDDVTYYYGNSGVWANSGFVRLEKLRVFTEEEAVSLAVILRIMAGKFVLPIQKRIVEEVLKREEEVRKEGCEER